MGALLLDFAGLVHEASRSLGILAFVARLDCGSSPPEAQFSARVSTVVDTRLGKTGQGRGKTRLEKTGQDKGKQV